MSRVAMVASDSLQLQTIEAIAETKEAPDYIRTNPPFKGHTVEILYLEKISLPQKKAACEDTHFNLQADLKNKAMKNQFH